MTSWRNDPEKWAEKKRQTRLWQLANPKKVNASRRKSRRKKRLAAIDSEIAKLAVEIELLPGTRLRELAERRLQVLKRRRVRVVCGAMVALSHVPGNGTEKKPVKSR